MFQPLGLNYSIHFHGVFRNYMSKVTGMRWQVNTLLGISTQDPFETDRGFWRAGSLGLFLSTEVVQDVAVLIYTALFFSCAREHPWKVINISCFENFSCTSPTEVLWGSFLVQEHHPVGSGQNTC